MKRKKKTKGSKKPCELCGQSFSDLPSLKEHKKTAHEDESGGKIFKCEFCEYSNILKRNLASHVKLRHEKDKFKVIYERVLATKLFKVREFQFVYILLHLFSYEQQRVYKETKWIKIAIFELNRTI